MFIAHTIHISTDNIYKYIDRIIPTAILFLLQDVYQLYTTNMQQKHTQIYLFLTTTYFDILWPQGALEVLTVTSGGFNCTLCIFVCILFVLFYDTLMMVVEATVTCRWIVIYDKVKYIVLMYIFWFVTQYKSSFMHGHGTYKECSLSAE